jgi:hypothetical protein
MVTDHHPMPSTSNNAHPKRVRSVLITIDRSPSRRICIKVGVYANLWSDPPLRPFRFNPDESKFWKIMEIQTTWQEAAEGWWGKASIAPSKQASPCQP